MRTRQITSSFKGLTLTLLATTSLVAATAAWAEPITSIAIAGNERVEAETIQSYLSFKTGDDTDSIKSSEIIRSLYGTGLFAHVEVITDNGKVTVKVVENPMVNRVAFEGNDQIDSKRLEEITSLKARAIYSPAKVQADVQALQAAYRSRGRFTANIKAQLIQRDQNRVDVVYSIDEGNKTRIAKINFVGNQRFSDDTLEEVVATKRTAWWRFLSSNDTYEPARMEVDKDLVRRYYLSRGYADVQVTSAVAELSRDRKDFVITYTVFEGPQYNFGDVDVALAAEAEGLKPEDLKPLVTLKKDELFNAKEVENTSDAMIDYLGNKGFAFLNVEPDYQKDEANKKVAVTFKITPGPRVYVNRIDIEGNSRTRDYVIRREMRVAEGDAFSGDKVKRSKDRLTYLGFFEDVDVTRAETDKPDRVDLKVKVKEQSTGEFNVGAGYSTFDGILATADVKERNFLGKGQEVAVKFAVSQRQQNFNVGFTEPYFLGQDLSAGVDAYNERIDYQSESSYDQANTGAGLRFGFPIDEFTRNTVGLGLRSTKIDGVGSAASQFVRRDEGTHNSLILSDTYSIDNRDSFLTPTRGYRVALTGEYSGFGTNTNFARGIAQASWHKSLADEWVLSLAGKTGAVWDIDSELPIFEHFQGGGSQQGLRGFKFGGIGPRDRTTQDALGGKYMVGNTVEMSFPLGTALKDMGVNGLVFTDGGYITDFRGANSNVVDSDTYRLSAGTGIFWKSPLGPLRLELAMPIVKAEEDQNQIFSFSVGSRF